MTGAILRRQPRAMTIRQREVQYMKHAHAVLYEACCTSCTVYAGPLHADNSWLPDIKRVHAVL